MFVYDFIEKIGRIEVVYSTKFRKQYITITEEFSSEQEYKEKLDEYLIKFRKEILSLPFSLNTKQSRKAFLNNLHDEFLYTRENLNEQFKKVISQSQDCISKQRVKYKCCFPRYLQKKYLTKARKEYQKLHIAFAVRIDKIENAVELLNTTCSSKEEKQIEKKLKRLRKEYELVLAKYTQTAELLRTLEYIDPELFAKVSKVTNADGTLTHVYVRYVHMYIYQIGRNFQ